MTTAPGRNDPCPCGSGRKYKACCMQADQAAARGAAVVPTAGEMQQVREALRAAARAAEAWQVDVVPVNAGPAEGAVSLAMVTAGGFVLHVEPIPTRPATLAARARVMADMVGAAVRVAGVEPQRVRIRDAAEVDTLFALLAPRMIEVEAGSLAELDVALDSALTHAGGGRVRAALTVPDTWAETGCTAAELADFHAAAADFYRAAPWEHFGDTDALWIRSAGDEEAWGASVLGAGEIEMGLVLYAHAADLRRLLELDDAPSPEDMLAISRAHTLTLTFDTREDLSRAMQREVARAGWEVAAPIAYPRLYGLRLPERRMTAHHVRLVTRMVRAVTLLAQGQDPEPSTGLQVTVEKGEADPWPIPEVASPILAEGPGADPGAALEEWRHEPGRVHALEQERYMRFKAWLGHQPLSKAARTAAVRNGHCWGNFLVFSGLPAGAVTEFDFRIFAFSFYPIGANTTQAAERDLPRSMRLILQFLEAEEGIRYPFAPRVMEELEAIAESARESKVTLRDALRRALPQLVGNLEARLLTFDRELPESTTGFWPDDAEDDLVIGRLEEELQRRWLLWYDEEVRAGNTKLDTLWLALEKRQRAWEDAPHPALNGNSPRDAIDEYALRDPGEFDDDDFFDDEEFEDDPF